MTTTAPAPPEPAATSRSSTTWRSFYWSVRRELWENRSIWVAPSAAAALVLLAVWLSTIGLPQRRRVLLMADPASQAASVAEPYHFAAWAVLVTMAVVGVAYSLGALYGERRDRSILFWKSLPVSDLIVVLAKASIPLVVLPAVCTVLILLAQLAIWGVVSLVLLAAGLSPTPATSPPLGVMWSATAYGIVTFTLWWAPVYAWLLLISGSAPRTPVLWAVLPPLLLCLLEKVALNTTVLAHRLGARLAGSFGAAFDLGPRGHGLTDPSPALDPLKFLSSLELWGGLAFALACYAAAAWLRRRREPI